MNLTAIKASLEKKISDALPDIKSGKVDCNKESLLLEVTSKLITAGFSSTEDIEKVVEYSKSGKGSVALSKARHVIKKRKSKGDS